MARTRANGFAGDQEAGERPVSKSSVKRVSIQLAEAPREKLVEIIDRQERESDMRFHDNLALCKEIDGLRIQLAALESQRRWRSVADDPPTGDDETYMVVRPSFLTDEPVVQLDFVVDGKWDGDAENERKATHWMPLPALPPAETEPTT